MTRFVVDAPTLLHLVAEQLEISPAHRLVAPNVLRSQALSLLHVAVHRGELTAAEALERHERLTAVRVRLLGDRVSRRTAWRIADELGHVETYAAEYLAVTRLQADALVTLDPDLRRAAAGVVPLADVHDLVR